MIAMKKIEEKIEKFDLYFRLKVKWNGKDRTSLKTIRINLTTSKMDTCSNHNKITRSHSCANAETPEDCESSCGVASGFYRWQRFPFLSFHVNANEIHLERALFSSSFSNRFQRNTALQVFLRVSHRSAFQQRQLFRAMHMEMEQTVESSFHDVRSLSYLLPGFVVLPRQYVRRARTIGSSDLPTRLYSRT